MNIIEIRSRYQFKSNKEVADFLKEHMEQINVSGAHVVFNHGKWSLDEEGVSIIDAILHFEEQPGDDSTDEASANTASPISPEAIELKNQVDALKVKLQEVTRQAEHYEQEYTVVSEQVVSLQSVHKGINTSLIRKTRQEAESLRNQLDHLKSQYDETIQFKDTRIKELESRMSDMQENLSQMNTLREKQAQTSVELLASQKEQEKLLKDLHEKEMEILALNDKVSMFSSQSSNNVLQNKLLRKDVWESIENLSEIITQLKSSVEVEESAPSAKKPVMVEDQPIMRKKQGPQRKAAIPKNSMPMNSLDEQRERIIRDARKAQLEKQDPQKTGIRGLLSRVASMIA